MKVTVAKSKVDLVMWTKNGAATLPIVLKAINNRVPSENVNQKYVVDDNSIDNTCSIAKALGWNVVANDGAGISDGANTALKLVDTDVFCSFEQDLLLSSLWWKRISKLFNTPKTVVASGVRYSSLPLYMAALEKKCTYSKRRGTVQLANTIDNTMYDTSYMKRRGFPYLKCGAGVDVLLLKAVLKDNLKWLIDPVESIHLKTGGLRRVCASTKWYGRAERELDCELGLFTLPHFIKIFCNSLFVGAYFSIKLGYPQIIYAYPAIRFSYLIGYCDRSVKHCLREKLTLYKKGEGCRLGLSRHNFYRSKTGNVYRKRVFSK